MKKIKILSLFVCLIALLAACEDEDITPSYGARTVLVLSLIHISEPTRPY